MEIPEYSEIELYPIQQIQSKLVFQSTLLKQIRGSNFKEQALFFVDNNQRKWLWKKLPLHSLVREYIVSFLAMELGIRVPQSLIARKGHSIGIVQEWIDSEDLTSFSDIQLILINNTDLFDLFVFEAWIGALDRHGGNYLTSHEGKLWGIDFENCFSEITNGSELCLYFPWIKDSKKELKTSIEKLHNQITEKRLLEIQDNFQNIVNVLQDPRAREALENQLIEIIKLLKHNFTQLDKTVDIYLEKSFSHPNIPLYT